MSPATPRVSRDSAILRIFSLALTSIVIICLLASSSTPSHAQAVGQWWNGFSQKGVLGSSFALLVDGERLLVGGSFTEAGGRELENLAAFDGQGWGPPGPGALDGFPGWSVSLLELHDGRVHAYRSMDGVHELLPEGWHTLEAFPLCGGFWLWDPVSHRVFDMVSWEDGLYSVGYLWGFESANRPLFCGWLPTCYTNLLPEVWELERNEISRVIEYQGDLILAGDFYLELSVLENMVRWDGANFEAFDAGFFVPGTGGVIHDLEIYGESLLALGWVQAGAFPSGIAEFDGQQWGDFQGGRVDGVIRAATVHDGMLYIEGDFTEIQGVPAAGLARWTGQAWESLADTPILGADHPVYDMLFFGEQLYLAGDFGMVDGVPSRSIARWYPPRAMDIPPFEGSWQLQLAAAPNPFNPQTTFRFELEAGGGAELEIYDLAGRRVAGTSLQDRGEGPGSWTWNGRDADGRELASGVYFARLVQGERDRRLRVTLLK